MHHHDSRVRINEPATQPPPQPTASPSLVQRVVDAFVSPEPQPPEPPQPPTIISASSSGGVQLIPDAEFMPSMHSVATENWKQSIADNVRLFPSRRGLTPTGGRYIG
jgi:hypothetical protein